MADDIIVVEEVAGEQLIVDHGSNQTADVAVASANSAASSAAKAEAAQQAAESARDAAVAAQYTAETARDDAANSAASAAASAASAKDILDDVMYDLSARLPDNSISSSKLKKTTDADRIGLDNLKQEVIQAMAGTTPVNSIPADNSITEAKIVDNVITYSKLKAPWGIIAADGNNQHIEVNYKTKEIKVILDTPILVDTECIWCLASNNTAPLNFSTTPDHDVIIIYFDRTSYKLKFTPYGQPVSDTKIVILAVVRRYQASGPNAKAIRIYDASGNFVIPGKYDNGAYVTFTDFIVYDRATNKITVPRFLINKHGTGFKSIAPADVGLSAFEFTIPQGWDLATLVIDIDKCFTSPQQNPFEFKTTAVFPAARNYILVLSSIWGKVNSPFPLKEINNGIPKYHFASIVSISPINFDFVNNKITFPTNSYIQTETGFWQIGPAEISMPDINVQDTGADGLHVMLWSSTENCLKVYHFTQIPTADLAHKNVLVLATWYRHGNGIADAIGCNFPCLVNGKPNLETYSYSHVQLSCRNPVNFDFVNRKIIFPQMTFIQTGSGFYYPNDPNPDFSGFEIDMPPATRDGLCMLGWDMDANRLKAYHFQDYSSIGNRTIVLASWYQPGSQAASFINCAFRYQINGKYPEELINLTAAQTDKYEQNACRLIVPPKMFFVIGEELPIYKDSIVPDNVKIKSAKMSIITTKSNGIPKYLDIPDSGRYITPADIPSNTFDIGIKQTEDQNKMYYATIVKQVVDPAANNGKNVKILCIGDSLTNRSIPQYLKYRLAEFGVNATMVGTMINNGERGEGREGWEYENFVGMDTLYYSTPLQPNLPGETTSDTSHNPFLKLATSEQIANFPDWCFRWTGSENEKSYATDTDKTGNFYIFDFARYLSEHSVDVPDVVTIALSTNDIWQDGTASLEQCRKAMEIMVKQIRSAVPNVKIGIIPAPAWGSNNSGNSYWINNVVVWIENCMNDIAAWNFSNVFVVPIWAHQNRDWSWDLSSVVDFSNVNKSKIGTFGEYVHFNERGKREYVNALAHFVLNVI